MIPITSTFASASSLISPLDSFAWKSEEVSVASLFTTTVKLALLIQLVRASLSLLRRWHRWYFSPLWRLPGPAPGNFLTGRYLEILREPFLAPHKRWIAEDMGGDVGRIPAYHYTSFLGAHDVVLLDPRAVKRVLFAPGVQRADPPYQKRLPRHFEYIGGRGLVLLEGEDWHRHRRIVGPSFRPSFLRKRLDAIVPSRVAGLIDFWKRAGRRRREIDVFSHLSSVTLDVIGEVGFSHDFKGWEQLRRWADLDDEENNDDDNDDRGLQESTDAFSRTILQATTIKPWRVLVRMMGLTRLANRSLVKASRLIDAACDRIIENARSAKATSNDDDDDRCRSILQLLFDAEDEEETDPKARKLRHDELRSEVKTFLIAGHETSSTWCYWALFVLTRRPDVQRKLHEDVTRHAPSDDASPLDLEAVERMVYLDAFLKEVLRYHPPAGALFRYNNSDERFDFDVGGDDGGNDGESLSVVVPRNTRITMPIATLHRHPSYWERPEEFWPERWTTTTTTTAAEDGKERTPPYGHPCAFLPFGAGPRNCVGFRFATMEVKLIMAYLVRAFSFESAPSQRNVDFEYRMSITIKSRPLLKVLATARSSTTE